MSEPSASEQAQPDGKPATPAADLFARKGSAKPAGLLIPYERRAKTSGQTPAVETDPAPEPLGDAGSLLTVIEFRKTGSGTTPEEKTEGKSITELAEAVSKAHGASAEAKPPKPDMAPFSRTTKTTSGALRPKPQKATSDESAKAPSVLKPTVADSIAPKTTPAAPKAVPKAPPPAARPMRQEAGSRLPLGLLIVVGLMLVVWVLINNIGSTPSQLETTPATSSQDTAPAAGEPAPEAAMPEPDAAAAPTPKVEATAAGEPVETTAAAVDPSFDLIRIEPDGEAVIAGRAAPGAELILLDNGEPIGRVTADWAGEWAFIPDEPLPQGDHQFSLVVAEPQGTVTLPAPEAAQEGQGKVQEQPPETNVIGDQSYLAAPHSDSTPLPGHKPDLEVKGNYFVQLSSVISLDGAEQERDKLQRVFPELLGDMKLAVEQAKLDESDTRYRVRAGLFAEAATASALCQQLRARSQDCLVIKQ